MSTGYIGAGGRHPHKVSFDWLGEAWKLFASSAPVWIAAIIVAVYAPLCIDAFVVGAISVSQKIAGSGAGGAVQALMHMGGLTFGLGLLNAAYSAFVLGGLAQMALKQVRGEPVSFRDIFSGGPSFGRMLVFGIVASLMIGVASGFILLPGVFLAGLLLPSLALTAAGAPLSDSISLSVKAMWPDRAIAMGLAFVLGVLTVIGSGFFTIGLLAALPLWFLVSALAYRDMIGFPETEVSLDDILGTVEPGRGVYLGGDAPFGYSPGQTPQNSLNGEPLDNGVDSSAPPKP
ncbi:hypothetical protein CCAX7_22570 [Capsulimonas corticalis]|uniref:Uncharacterized protein n=1 Tax=Capsulimonas corticalis TaxID=2219043 RepID=A0A402CUU2_9BACT|nr:hypothetical protein [Capsulimonas corticalis]BDI30206.1 hypothetical protein CCAX7_22570 [Capsulimonas corticalis]